MVTLIYSSCGEYIVHACSASTQLWYISSSTVKGIKLLNPEGYKDDGVYKWSSHNQYVAASHVL